MICQVLPLVPESLTEVNEIHIALYMYVIKQLMWSTTTFLSDVELKGNLSNKNNSNNSKSLQSRKRGTKALHPLPWRKAGSML